MTVHMIRIQAEKPSGITETEANNAVDNWVQNHTEWTADTIPHELTVTNTAMDGSGTDYFNGNYRFEASDDLTVLLDDAETVLQNIGIAWYRLGYHACDHDENDRSGCSWDGQHEYGSVPNEIPSFL